MHAFDHTTSFSNRIVHDWHRDGDDSTGPGVDGVHADLLIGRDFADRLARRRSDRPLFTYFAPHLIHESKGHSDGVENVRIDGRAGADTKNAPLYQVPRAYLGDAPADVDGRYYSPWRVLGGMFRFVDAIVGNVSRAHFAAHEDNILVFTSDNGAASDRADRDRGGNRPLRGAKHDYWEGGIRVPAFVVGGGLRRGAVLRRAVAANVDWLPTLVGRADPAGTFAPRNALDGLDLWPVLSGDRPESALEDRELLHNLDVSRRPVRDFKGALRRGRHKLVVMVERVKKNIVSEADGRRALGSSKKEKKKEKKDAKKEAKREKHRHKIRLFLFDLLRDPGEEHSIVKKNATLAASMYQALQKLEADVSTCWGLPHAVPPGEQEDCDNFPMKRDCHFDPDAKFISYKPGWCADHGSRDEYHAKKLLGEVPTHKDLAVEAGLWNRLPADEWV